MEKKELYQKIKELANEAALNPETTIEMIILDIVCEAGVNDLEIPLSSVMNGFKINQILPSLLKKSVELSGERF